ncbi:chromatin assembly factor 1 subunit A-B-like [Ruditapes philippinarum]|uniref:chromatin assembly factor 1 subunit A-B-like n=1 Tax=Ruditapes philippinarum TaxID=129788 RepID=UPI00295B893F|nr:chromatin assembly factor 1 subunit A-B-like [Ruditapes philippinarum]
MIVCLKGKCCRERRTFNQKKRISSQHDTSEIISEKVINEEPKNQTSKEKLYINNGIQTTLSSNDETATQGKSLNNKDERSQFNNDDMFDLSLEMSRPDHKTSGQMSTSTINSDKNTTECTQEDIILGKCSVPCIANQELNGNVSCGSKLTDDIVEPLDSNDVENIIENKSDEIVVTRITKIEKPLRKDMPHLNSTENIFSDFDATVTNETENYNISKSDLSIIIDCVENKNNQKNVFVFSRDDSALDMETDNKTMSKIKTQDRMHKSEGNLVDAIEKGNSTRISSEISYEPLEWNFVYRSPYALSDKQKQDIIDKRVKLKKKKEQIKRQKEKEKEKRLQKNQLAFEKWKQSKMKTTTAKNKSLENVYEKAKSTFWYPT